MGYPRLASFMCMDSEFTILKRFDYLHLRNLLYHSDILAKTEERLRWLDQQETVQTYLSSRRQDRNIERQNLLLNLDEQLKAYGNVLIRVPLLMHASATYHLFTLVGRRGCRTVPYVNEHSVRSKTESTEYLQLGQWPETSCAVGIESFFGG